MGIGMKSQSKQKYSKKEYPNKKNKFVRNQRTNSKSNIESNSDSEEGPDEDEFFTNNQSNNKKKNNKHAPKETKISHRPVSVVRDIPGLKIYNNRDNNNLSNNLDVRFDTALGKSLDYETIRKQYSFLDDYREKEINEMKRILKDKKLLSRLSDNEINEIKYKLQSTFSKLEALKKKDREKLALKNYIKENKDKSNKFLTRAEKRKVLLIDRFENMNSKQKNKSIERKRKRKLGKEMRQLEFSNNNRN